MGDRRNLGRRRDDRDSGVQDGDYRPTAATTRKRQAMKGLHMPTLRVTAEDYLKQHFAEAAPGEYTEVVRFNVETLIPRINRALDYAVNEGGVLLEVNPKTGTLFTSGWRPRGVNARIGNAAPNSKHMTGQAGDVYDPEGMLDDYYMSQQGLTVLEVVGLWMEHPSATKGWCHLQSIPPNSGRRVFYP